MLDLALHTRKLGQHVRFCLGQGAASLWFLLRESTVLLLSMRAKPTSDQQARALACTLYHLEQSASLILQCIAPAHSSLGFPRR